MKIRIVEMCIGAFLLFNGRFTLPVQAFPLQLVSAKNSGQVSALGATGDSFAPIVSPDGRYVLFASSANDLILINSNVPSALSPARMNVYLRDRTNLTTSLISVNLSGTAGGNGDSWPREISSDGRFVLFESSASNLVTGDTNGVGDVFVRDLAGNLTLLVSVSTNGGPANGLSRSSVMTPDGHHVAFVSGANNLVPQDTNNISDVFVRDLQSGTTLLASAGARIADPVAVNSSESPDLTPDGRYVAFYSSATNLLSGARVGGEVFIRDLVEGTTIWASTNALALLQSTMGGTKVVSFNQRISADGQFVAYEAAPSAGSFSSARGVILRFNRLTGLTDLVFTNANVPTMPVENVRSLDLSPDGRFIVFVANVYGTNGATTCVYEWDALTGSNSLASGNLNINVSSNSMCDFPAVDATGRYVAFLSSNTNLTTNTLVGDYHMYVRDMLGGGASLVDADMSGVGIPLNPTTAPSLSADGRFVAFECLGANYWPSNRARGSQVFMRDLGGNSTELISASLSTTPTASANSALFTLSVNTNGRYVAFVSEADNLTGNGTNAIRDVYVRDLVAGTNLLVSVSTNGEYGDGPSSQPSISGDGRYVAFASSADNLVAGDNNKLPDIFVRDLLAGSSTLVSVGVNGIDPGNKSSASPAISVDGHSVLFRSKAQNLAAGSFNGTAENVFWRDLQSGSTYALTTAGAPAAAMSSSGQYVAFGRTAGNVYVWDAQLHAEIFTNTVTTAISAVTISSDGTHLAYTAGSGPVTLYVADLSANSNRVVGTGFFPSHAGLRFSADGRFLAYSMTRTPVATGTNDVYLYDFQTGTNAVVSKSFNPPAAPNGSSDSPNVSPDGRFVTYRSFASNIVPGDSNSVPDVFLYDRLTGATTLLSANLTGDATANDRSLSPFFSADGQMLFFQSWASDLIAQDFNQAGDAFAFKIFSDPIMDTDGDGMDDAWELQHFNTLARDGAEDFDGDGVSDLIEFLAGTDPKDPASVFRGTIVFAGTPVQGPTVTWPAASGKAYQVQFKNRLSDPDWQNLAGNITLVGKTGRVNDPTPTADQKFYRIVLLTP